MGNFFFFFSIIKPIKRALLLLIQMLKANFQQTLAAKLVNHFNPVSFCGYICYRFHISLAQFRCSLPSLNIDSCQCSNRVLAFPLFHWVSACLSYLYDPILGKRTCLLVCLKCFLCHYLPRPPPHSLSRHSYENGKWLSDSLLGIMILALFRDSSML